MTIYGLLTFCAVYALAVATPGPGIAAVIARSLAHGFKGAPAFVAGFMVGDLAWFAIAATGLAALAKTAATAVRGHQVGRRRLSTVPGVEALDARRRSASTVESDRPRQHGWRAFLASLMLTLANPKAILFFLALLPTVIDLASMNTRALRRDLAGHRPSSCRGAGHLRVPGGAGAPTVHDAARPCDG